MSQRQSAFRFADESLLSELVALLPEWEVMAREGQSGIVFPMMRDLAAQKIKQALCEGWTIDRTNGDGDLAEWDGWLVVSSPAPLFLRIAAPGGVKLT